MCLASLTNTYVFLLCSCAIADGVFIGPYDLSLALGFPPPSPDPHPEVEKVIQQILAAAHARGKKWCVLPDLSLPLSLLLCLPPLHIALDPDADLHLLCSAFYCTSGAQAAQRAKEGFDMVRFCFPPNRPPDG